MKKSLLLLSAFVMLNVLDCLSQPVIDKLYDYQPGMVYSYLKIPSGTIIDTNLLPTYGADLMWDLDLLPWENDIQNDSIYSFEQSSQPSEFATCSFVYKEYGGLEQFYRKSNDTMYYMGNSSSNQQFLPNAITVIYPTIYKQNGYSFSDYHTHVPWNDDWVYSARYNAYGTLKLSSINITDVALYVLKGGKPGQFYIDYMWVRQGETHPLVRIQFVQTSNNFSVQFAYGLATAVFSVDEAEVKNSLHVYPNPSKGKVFINGADGKQTVLVKQYDISGNLMAERFYMSSSQIDYDLMGKRGMYILEIFEGDKSLQHIKVIKE